MVVEAAVTLIQWSIGVIERKRRGAQCEFHANRLRRVFGHTPFHSFHSGPTASVRTRCSSWRDHRGVVLGRAAPSGSDLLSSGKHVYPAAFWTRQNSHLLKGESLFPLQVQQPLLIPFHSQTPKQRGTISQQFNRRKIGLALTTAPWMESIHSRRDTAGSRQCSVISYCEWRMIL